MEDFGLYLFKSASWLSGFALIYLIFLRNERYFELNRIYLFTGLLTSLFFPFISISNSVIIPFEGSIASTGAYISGIAEGGTVKKSFISLFFWGVYLSGIVLFVGKSIAQNHSVLKAIKGSEIIPFQPAKLIRTHEYSSSFSFFSFVFVNPSITDKETNEILNHELVHIRQKHWIDLILAELLCIMQWFNPIVWIYSRLIKQNHEYLADKVALQRTSDPAIYKATLLNQIIGQPVINLANSFNYSLNNKRFNMMKNIICSPYRKLKVLFILPVFALILYSFAKPVYEFSNKYDEFTSLNPGSNFQTSIVKGFITDPDNEPLIGASVIMSNSKNQFINGTVSNEKGYFQLENVPEKSMLVISFVSFKTIQIKPDFKSDMKIKMSSDTVKFNTVTVKPPMEENTDKLSPIGGHPLVIIDGTVKDIEINKIDPETIQSINIIKDKTATDKYGEKAKDGAIEVMTKSAVQTIPNEMENGGTSDLKSDQDVFYIVEDMPKFPGGGEGAMQLWISQNTIYPSEALSNKISGEVTVNFTVNGKGKITNVNVPDPVNALLDAEAIRVISAMPDWQPGKQRGKNVSVRVSVPVNFKLD